MTNEEIAKAIQQAAEMTSLERARFEGSIADAVLICSPKNKHIIKNAIPTLFVISSPYCTDEQCYMVTDKELAKEMKRTIWRESGGLDGKR